MNSSVKHLARLTLVGVFALVVMTILPSGGTVQAAATWVPLYRLWNATVGDHFYTTSDIERRYAETQGYTYEKVAGYVVPPEVLPSDPSGLVPLYELWSPSVTDHFYTTDAGERDKAEAQGWGYYGIAAFVYPPTAAPPAAGLVPLYRLWYATVGDHFYTTDAGERDKAATQGWNYEGIAAYVAGAASPPPAAGGDLVPLYRLWNGSFGDHFYTTLGTERHFAETLGYTYEKIAGYVVPPEVPPAGSSGLVPLYRLWSSSVTDHFYTIDAGERDKAVQTYGYAYEGIAAYVSPPPAAPTFGLVPLYRLRNDSIGDHFYTTDVGERDTAVKTYGYIDEGIAAYVFSPPLLAAAACPAGIPTTIPQKYDSLGGPGGTLGQAITLVAPTADGKGCYQLFEDGAIIQSPNSGVSFMHRGIYAKWAAIGAEKSSLGYPENDEQVVKDKSGAQVAAYSVLQGGDIFWSTFGTYTMEDDVLRTWLNWDGWALLGYPQADQAPAANGGVYSRFQRGRIYRGPQTQAWWVRGPFMDKWASLNYEQGCLGYPTGPESPGPIPNSLPLPGATQSFQHGTLTWNGSSAISSCGEALTPPPPPPPPPPSPSPTQPPSPQLADLRIVGGINLIALNTGLTIVFPTHNQPFRAEWQVCNLGTAPASNFTDTAVLSDSYGTKQTFTIDPFGVLQPPGCVMQFVNFDNGLPAGSYFLDVYLDVNGAVKEATPLDKHTSINIYVAG